MRNLWRTSTKYQINVYVNTKARTIKVNYFDEDIKNRLQYNICNSLFFSPWVDWEKDIDDWIEYWFKLTRAHYLLIDKSFPKYINIIKTDKNILGGLDEESCM